jgi:geranylgeranyl pyrophosphate synthase
MTELVEKALDEVLSAADVRPASLSQAMRWAVTGGGKRVRPRICLAAAIAAGGRAEDAIFPACAIELLHSYTLVHDDLPAMDDDTERRGRPSVWAKFGEATAILAGDALQALAFATVARSRYPAETMAVLARAACAVVEGQVEDLSASESLNGLNALNGLKDGNGQELLESVFLKKTAALFSAAAEMGALAVGAAAETAGRLSTYGRELGMAFQYEDDLLDADCGAFSSLAILGREEVVRRVAAHTDAATAALAGLPGDTVFLSTLAANLANRKN